jgi:hypothetical protein
VKQEKSVLTKLIVAAVIVVLVAATLLYLVQRKASHDGTAATLAEIDAANRKANEAFLDFNKPLKKSEEKHG